MSSLFGFPLRSDEGTFSAGSWELTLPLANLQDADVSKKARSTDATTGSTRIDIDLGAASWPIRGIALIGHNLSLAAQVRVYGDDAANFASPNYDPGIENAYPVIYGASDTIWGITPGAVALTAVEFADGVRHPFIHLPSSAQTERYWRIDITDTGNSDGYVEIGRLVAFQGWQPTTNPQVGSRIAFVSESETVPTDGGTFRHRARPRYRRMFFTIPMLELDESLIQVTELLRRIGTTEQVFYVQDIADTIHLHRRSMLATLQEATALEFPVAGDWGDTPFVLVEAIAP